MKTDLIQLDKITEELILGQNKKKEEKEWDIGISFTPISFAVSRNNIKWFVIGYIFGILTMIGTLFSIKLNK